MRIIGFVMIPLLGMVLVFVRKPVSARSTPTGVEGGTASEKNKNSKAKKDFSGLKQPAFILLCSGLALAFFGFFVPLFYTSVWATSLGFSENFAFYLISILNGASLFGRILPGFVADRYGPFNILTLAAFVSGVVVFCWTAATSTAGLIIWTIAYGFTSGALLSLQLACATSLVSENVRGAAIGAVMGSVSLTGLFGTPIAGELVKSGYLATSCFAGAMLMVGGVLLGAARMAKSRKLFAKV